MQHAPPHLAAVQAVHQPVVDPNNESGMIHLYNGDTGNYKPIFFGNNCGNPENENIAQPLWHFIKQVKRGGHPNNYDRDTHKRIFVVLGNDGMEGNAYTKEDLHQVSLQFVLNVEKKSTNNMTLKLKSTIREKGNAIDDNNVEELSD